MSMKILNKQLKEKNIGKLYFFTGEEQYLVRHYVNEIVNTLLPENVKALNYNVFEEKVTFRQVEDAVSMYPAFSERRVVVVRESDLFKSGEKQQYYDEFFRSLPGYICLIFIQGRPDKRTSLYKALKNNGLLVECDRQKADALTRWVIKVFASYNKKISESDAAFLVGLLEPDMTFMRLEIEKIACYMGEKTEVTRGIISDIVTRSAKTRVFDLIDAMSQRKMSDAIRIMDELTELKEPVPLIMAMIGRQFFTLLKAKKLKERKVPKEDMAKILGIMPYFIDKTMKQASNFSAEDLKRLAARCTDIDFAVKTGRIDGRLAIELLLMEID
ncbi:MAG: DNA polymerase III subunit delta [Clostridiaceae bacterium]|nr:DNA polymerase III subunit delta [Clostridiaceae bacterium]